MNRRPNFGYSGNRSFGNRSFSGRPRGRFFQRPVNQLGNRINEAISVSPIRLISEKGEQIGIIETYKALEMAKEAGLDLVEIAPTAKPPVCKIIDWGKFQYQESKKKQDAKTNQKKTEMKVVRLRPATGENDLEVKRKQIEKFLEKNNKVKVEVVIRGREKMFINQAREKLFDFIDKIKFPLKIEQQIMRQPNGFNILLAPDAGAKKADSLNKNP